MMNNANIYKDVNNTVITERQLSELVENSLNGLTIAVNKIKALKSKIDEACVTAEGLTPDKQIKKETKPWLWFTVDDDEKTIENIQNYLVNSKKAIVGLAGAQKEAQEVISSILESQQQLAKEMKYLHGLGIVNLHQCRFVSESITLRLHRGSEGELTEAEKDCLNNVLADLERQEEYLRTLGDVRANRDLIEANKIRIDKVDDSIREIIASDTQQEVELGKQRAKDKEHDDALEAQRAKDKEHDDALEAQRAKDKEHDDALEAQRARDKEHDARLDAHERQIADLYTRLGCGDIDGVPVWMKVAVCVSVVLSAAALVVALVK